MAWIRLDDEFANHEKVRGLSNAAFRLWLIGKSYCACYRTDGYIPVDEAEALAFKCIQADRRHGVTGGVTPGDLIDELVRPLAQCHGVTGGVTDGVTDGVTPPGQVRDGHARERDIERDGHARERDIERDTPRFDRGDFEHWLWEKRSGGYQVHDWTDYNPTSARRDREKAQAAERKRWQRDKGNAISLLESNNRDRAVSLLAKWEDSRADQIQEILWRHGVTSSVTDAVTEVVTSHGVTSSVTQGVTDSPRTPSPSPLKNERTYVRHGVTSGVTRSVTPEYERGILGAGWGGSRHSLSPEEKVLAATWESRGFPLDVVITEMARLAESFRSQRSGEDIAWLKFFAPAVEREGEMWLERAGGAEVSESWPAPVPVPEEGREVWDRLVAEAAQEMHQGHDQPLSPLLFQGLADDGAILVHAPTREYAASVVLGENFHSIAARLGLQVRAVGLDQLAEGAA